MILLYLRLNLRPTVEVNLNLFIIWVYSTIPSISKFIKYERILISYRI
jgi:hypothetical protein